MNEPDKVGVVTEKSENVEDGNMLSVEELRVCMLEAI